MVTKVDRAGQPLKPVTKEEIAAALAMCKAIADTIKELGSVPSGHLYARLMGTLTLSQYNNIIRVLKEGKFIKEENHLLTWIYQG